MKEVIVDGLSAAILIAIASPVVALLAAFSIRVFKRVSGSKAA